MAPEKPPRFYTTEVPAHKSVAEIQELLAKHGSEHQHVVGHMGRPQGLYFTIPHPHEGEPLGVKLEAPVEAVERRLEASSVIPSDHGDPLDVAWRLIKWTVEVRCEHIANLGTSMFREFLPDIVTDEGRTVEEELLEGGERLLPGGRRLLSSPTG